MLSDQLSTTTSEKITVSREKDSLSTAKQRLEKEKQKLFVKANKASAIMLEKMEVKGYVIKKNGKQSTESDADDLQMLKICFNMLKNEIADAGQELFYIRIIGPDGNTLYDEKAGSGMMTKSSDDTKMNYTKKYLVDYNGQAENICLVWNKEIPLTKENIKLNYTIKDIFPEPLNSNSNRSSEQTCVANMDIRIFKIQADFHIGFLSQLPIAINLLLYQS